MFLGRTPPLRLASLFLSALLAAAPAMAAEGGDTSFEANAGIASRLFDDGRNQSQLAGLSVGFSGMHRFEPSLRANVNLSLQADAGNSQVVFLDDYKSQKGFTLSEASLSWDPLPGLSLTAGALDQARFQNPLLLSSISFAGLVQTYRLGSEKAYAEVSIEEAVPSSDVSSPVATETNGIPNLVLGEARVGYESPAKLKLKGHAGYFGFANLPNVVAQQSRFRGNTITGTGEAGAKFIYSYGGPEGGVSASWESPYALTPFLGVSALLNLNAPSGFGIYGSLGTEILLSPSVSVSPKLELFHNEADSSPALYSSPDYGHNGFEGFGAGVAVALKKSQFNIEGRWVTGSLLGKNPYQGNFNTVFITMSKAYAIF